MDFSEIINRAKEQAIQNNEPVNIKTLPPREYFPIDRVKMFTTGKGKSVIVTLQNGQRVWLPFEYARFMEQEQVDSINAANNYEIAFLGMVDDKSRIPNVDVRLKNSVQQEQGQSSRTRQVKRKGDTSGQGKLVKIARRFVIEGNVEEEGYYQLGDPIILSDDE